MTAPSLPPSSVYRTPDSRFVDLPDFPYAPEYAHWGNLRYAYIDVLGPIIDLTTGKQVESSKAQGEVITETVLCLHGEPTWSYLYRKMIPGFLSDVAPRQLSGPSAPRCVQRRVVVPDLIGFGRSDKPIDDAFYTWDMHRQWLVHFVYRHLVEDARTGQGGRVTLVVQDWGGILGLLLPSLFPVLFTHLIVMNTGMGIGKLPSKAWVAFRDFIKRSPDVDVGALLARGTPLSEREVQAYRAPFEGKASKAGVRRFPELVPVDPAMRGVPDSMAAMAYFRSLPPTSYVDNSLKTPFVPQLRSENAAARTGRSLAVFVCAGKADPVLGEPVMRNLAKKAWGESTGFWWHVIEEGGHFVQEWSAHLPALADLVWSHASKDTSVRHEKWQAEWQPASRPQSKM